MAEFILGAVAIFFCGLYGRALQQAKAELRVHNLHVQTIVAGAVELKIQRENIVTLERELFSLKQVYQPDFSDTTKES